MGGYRYDLNERAIKYDLLHDMTLEAAAQKYRCSIGLIRSIKEGSRPAKRGPTGTEMCECCGFRPKAPGNRFLCEWCFRNAVDEDDVEYGQSGYKLLECGWDQLLE